MTLFDRILINLHRGAERLKKGAALFSERLKFEIAVIRMRIRIDDLRTRIKDLHAQIGRKAADLKETDPDNGDIGSFLRDEDVHAAIEEIAALKKEIEDIVADLEREQKEIFDASRKDDATGERIP